MAKLQGPNKTVFIKSEQVEPPGTGTRGTPIVPLLPADAVRVVSASAVRQTQTLPSDLHGRGGAPQKAGVYDARYLFNLSTHLIAPDELNGGGVDPPGIPELDALLKCFFGSKLGTQAGTEYRMDTSTEEYITAWIETDIGHDVATGVKITALRIRWRRNDFIRVTFAGEASYVYPFTEFDGVVAAGSLDHIKAPAGKKIERLIGVNNYVKVGSQTGQLVKAIHPSTETTTGSAEFENPWTAADPAKVRSAMPDAPTWDGDESATGIQGKLLLDGQRIGFNEVDCTVGNGWFFEPVEAGEDADNAPSSGLRSNQFSMICRESDEINELVAAGFFNESFSAEMHLGLIQSKVHWEAKLPELTLSAGVPTEGAVGVNSTVPFAGALSVPESAPNSTTQEFMLRTRGPGT